MSNWSLSPAPWSCSFYWSSTMKMSLSSEGGTGTYLFDHTGALVAEHRGDWIDSPVWATWRSLRQIPHASTRTRISPGPGSFSSASTISKLASETMEHCGAHFHEPNPSSANSTGWAKTNACFIAVAAATPAISPASATASSSTRPGSTMR